MSTAVVLRIKPFVWWRSRRRCRRGLLKAPANEDTLLRTHCCRHKCFPFYPRAQQLLRTQILCLEHKKCFWFCSETFRVRNKCFPVCAAQETSWATMCPQQRCPRLPGPLSSLTGSATSTGKAASPSTSLPLVYLAGYKANGVLPCFVFLCFACLMRSINENQNLSHRNILDNFLVKRT